MNAVVKSDAEWDSIALKLADKGKAENERIIQGLDQEAKGLSRKLAVYEAFGLSWLPGENKAFRAYYDILTGDRWPALALVHRHSVHPRAPGAILLGLRVWHRVCQLAVLDPKSILDLIAVQGALRKQKGSKMTWAVTVGLKIAALCIGAKPNGSEEVNLLIPPLGSDVCKGFEKVFGVRLKGNERDCYAAWAIHTFLARRARSNVMDINTGLLVEGRGK